MRFWNFAENPDNAEDVELRIDGDIVDDGIAWLYEWFGIPASSPNAFREALASYKNKNITVWINSDGGDVFAGAGIYTALKEHQGMITVKIEKAISAASVIAMAGTEIQMTPVGIVMIHNPLGNIGWAEAKDMRHAADVLDIVKETIMNAYQLRTKKSRDDIAKMMDEETWMSAQKAMSEGFADGILYTDNELDGTVQNSFMFSRMAILNKNSISASMKQFIEQYNQKYNEMHPSEPTPKETQSEKNNGLLSLYQNQVQINLNKVRR